MLLNKSLKYKTNGMEILMLNTINNYAKQRKTA
jgi:hypothetical protein